MVISNYNDNYNFHPAVFDYIFRVIYKDILVPIMMGEYLIFARSNAILSDWQSYIIKFSLSVCLSLSMFVRNRLQNHAYYGDEAFAGDSVGIGLGQTKF